MKTHALLLLAGITAVSQAAPVADQWNRPVAFDDGSVGGILERRSLVKVEVITSASSSPFTNEEVTKVTSYVQDKAKDTLRNAPRPAGIAAFFADSNPRKHPEAVASPPDGDVITTILYSHNRKLLPFLTTASASGRLHDRHHRHRISLAGFRNRLAVFMLGFAVISALACSALRRMYIESLEEADIECATEPASEKERLLRADRQHEPERA